MGQCVLKDCGFEFQKLEVKKGVSFPEFFKEKMKENKLKKQSKQEKISSQHQTPNKPNESNYLSTEEKPYEFKRTENLIPQTENYSKSKENSFQESPTTLSDQISFNKPEGKISDLGFHPISDYKRTRQIVKRLKINKLKTSSQNFIPLLDSMRDSFENKSRLQSKIFLNDKYEKSSLFKIAQNNFRKNNSEDDFSENSDTYENIFSDGEISVKNSKNNGFFTPTTSNIINLNLKSEKE